MSGEGKAVAALADRVASGALEGKTLKKLLQEIAEGGSVKVTAEEADEVLKTRPPLPDIPEAKMNLASQLPPSDLRVVIPRQGGRLRAMFERLADRFPAIKRKLQQGETLASAIGTKGAPSVAARTAERGVARTSLLAWLDLQSREARDMLEEAVGTLPASLQARVRPLTQRALTGNLESFAAQVARGLGKEEAPAFVRAVHERVCRAIRDQVLRELDDPALAKQIEQAFAEATVLAKRNPAVAPLFRARLRGLAADEEAGALIERVVRRLEGADRERFVKEFLASIAEDGARTMLDAHFDAEGLRRLLAAYASFRKVYSVKRMRQAMEGLIGWLYEASTFVSRIVREAAEAFQKPLAAALRREGVGVVAGNPLLHFDVMAPELAGKKIKQATDALGTVPLSSPKRTVHVLASALEAKGVEGVAEGVVQLELIPRRYKKGAVVTTEHGTFTMGKDLFLSVEDALAELGVATEIRKRIVKASRAETYATVVVSPLGEAAAKARYGDALKGVLYRGHPVSREQMVKFAESLAPRFSLVPLEAGAKAR